MNKTSENKKIGALAAIASAILFGTMPLATKTAFAYGANTYMVTLGRFFWGSLGIGLLYASDGKASKLGLTLALLSGLVYAVYIVRLRKSRLETVPLMTLSFWISLMATAELFILALVAGQVQFTMNAYIVGAEIYLGIFATAIAFILFQKGIFLCGPVQVSLLSSFEPVTGVIIGMLVYGEMLTFRKTSGIVLILFSAILLVLSDNKKK